ncbi:hypothetical protein HL13_gp79 [Dinoroseobacter phage DFL12phi1]|uniref:Uncharacterized protein n=1 Tax=Dinoroseobacter phage DFL12phi1 TaxID=1477404 RepID=A0A023NHW6_9CAUD|nr:hypothetical protein HL13_gp79 [Dinoroseobacter phage DFL12phi1]AHX01039.1 hypothetical protein DFL12P1_0079 [Dinoroseobacter phage DFL12phi1]
MKSERFPPLVSQEELDADASTTLFSRIIRMTQMLRNSRWSFWR